MDQQDNIEHRQDDPGEVQEDISPVERPLPLTEELEEVTRERDQYQSAMQRAQADLINYRRRAEEERGEAIKHANGRLLNRVLPVLDDFSMAFEQAPEDASQQPWLEGFRLIHRKLHSMTEAEGVTRIEAEDKPFDPAEHEALAQVESAEHDDGQVVQVVRDGYKLHDRVLRPAQVIISVRPQPEAEEQRAGADFQEDKET